MQFDSKQINVPIDISSSGDNTIVAALSAGDGYYAIDHINVLPTSAVTVKVKTGSTEQTGPYPLDAKQPFTFENPSEWRDGIMHSGVEEAIIINLSDGVQVGGFIRYRRIGN